MASFLPFCLMVSQLEVFCPKKGSLFSYVLGPLNNWVASGQGRYLLLKMPLVLSTDISSSRWHQSFQSLTILPVGDPSRQMNASELGFSKASPTPTSDARLKGSRGQSSFFTLVTNRNRSLKTDLFTFSPFRFPRFGFGKGLSGSTAS